MSTLFEALTTAGSDALRLFWWPVALWTTLAGVSALALHGLPARFAREHYELRTALLASLPLGIGLAIVFRALQAPSLMTVPLPYEIVVYANGASGSTTALVPLPAVPFSAMLLAVSASLVAVVGMTRFIMDVRALASIDRTVEPVTRPDALGALDDARREYGVNRFVRLVATDRVSVPAAYGLRRPTIVVPNALLDRPDDLRLVLLHETAHLAHGDFALDAMARFVRGLFGWHPLVAWLGRSQPYWREAACDLAVLDVPAVDRVQYARVLLSTAESLSPTREGLLASMGSISSSLTQRIEAMSRIQNRTPTLPLARHLSVAAVFLVLVSFTACSDSAPAAAPPPDEAEARATDTEALAGVGNGGAQAGLATPDEMPSPIGGMTAIASAIAYPEAAKAARVQGRVIVSFVVNADGTVGDAKVLEGIDAELDAEALRVIGASRWNAGKSGGKPVAAQLALPISFKLQ